jgi:hypothetical protein
MGEGHHRERARRIRLHDVPQEKIKSGYYTFCNNHFKEWLVHFLHLPLQQFPKWKQLKKTGPENPVFFFDFINKPLDRRGGFGYLLIQQRETERPDNRRRTP